MELIPWSDKYAVDIATIDEQHKKLIGLLNELGDAMTVGKGRDVLGRVLGDLVEYTNYHFSTEEELFRKHAYPDEQKHRQEHSDLTTKAKKLKQDFDDGNWMLTIDTLKFLSSWLSNHIQVEDRKYAPFLKGKGVQ